MDNRNPFFSILLPPYSQTSPNRGPKISNLKIGYQTFFRQSARKFFEPHGPFYLSTLETEIRQDGKYEARCTPVAYGKAYGTLHIRSHTSQGRVPPRVARLPRQTDA